MYRPGKTPYGPPPFGPPQPYGSPFRPTGPCVPPPGHLSPKACGPFSTSVTDSLFHQNRQPRGHFIRPHCSNFPIDGSSMIALGGRQQFGPSAEPPHSRVPQWNPTPAKHHNQDNSERASEEFLRCIAANKPLPDYLKGNMAYNLADALKSANILKEAVKPDIQIQKHVTRSKSRSQSRGRSRGKSRAKSCARSKSKARSRSRGRSKSHARGKSRGRSKSRARGKSRGRSKSRSRSWSRSKKSPVRSKSRIRRSKSRSSSGEQCIGKERKRKRSTSSSSIGSSNRSRNCLLEGLKLVIKSKELEERLPTLKDAILTIQASDESKKRERLSDGHRHQQPDSQENSTSLEPDNVLLPHDRVGNDFSWLQVQSQEDSIVQKADELEDEESFLYGNEDLGANIAKSLTMEFSQLGEDAKLRERDSFSLNSQQHHQNKSEISSFGDLFDLKQPLQSTCSSLASATLGSSECEKINNILKSLDTANINEIMAKVQGQKEGKQLLPALLSSDPTAVGLALPALSDQVNVRQALESLQSLIKATKEKRAKGDGSGTSQTASDKHKTGEEERKREKQVTMAKIDSLMKELEESMKQDGLSFLTPVIGFYCQKCEEFIGDLNSAENHASIHCSNSSGMDKHAEDKKVHLSNFSSSNNQHPHPSDRRDQRNYDYHRGSGDYRIHRDYERDLRDEGDHRSHRARQENISLKEEMRKERMLITVSGGLTSLPGTRVKKEIKTDVLATGSQNKIKAEDTESKGKPSQIIREKDESSDSSDNDKGKPQKAKSLKRKKKKKKQQKKEKKKNKS